MHKQVEKGIKDIWPEAVYMPWSPVPIGQKVRRLDRSTDSASVGVVVGQVPFGHSFDKPHCNSCKCIPKQSGIAGWWTVKYDGVLCRETQEEYVAAEYPPSLIPITENA